MTSPQSVHHALLRPCVLHILRAVGYHSTRPSVLDTLTDIAGRFLFLLAKATAEHSVINHGELEVAIEDVRMAMQDCGAIAPDKILEDQIYDGEEDMRGVAAFMDWVNGPVNNEIRRIALEGGDVGKEDYLTALKKKHDKTGDETRYQSTILGKSVDQPRSIIIEGSEITSIKQWAEMLRNRPKSETESLNPSRRQSSDLSSLDGTMDGDHQMVDAFND